MAYSIERLLDIFIKTDGNCHICHGMLTFQNYGRPYARGGWEVEHSVPRARGGTDRLNNLLPAHVSCNRRKRDGSTWQARALHGKTRAPYSREKKAQIRGNNTVQGLTAGAVAGGLVAGPAGVLVGAVVGGLFGHSVRVPK
ncbi:HNH endonuclease [Sorangium sp. So ce448]|uniref:HNH endonuclease n=1 Tax=Sorangium sp. So ce448 TaxID=3133314 RepID=UPI003F61B009